MISLTHHSNNIYSNQKTVKPEDCFTDNKTFQQALQHTMIAVANDWTKYRVNKEYAKIQHKWVLTPYKFNIHKEMIIKRLGGAHPQKIIKPLHVYLN